ncbi:MAG: TIGR01777 family oxidoreductase [Nitrospinae bacterium]|jgi:uncharacterized protein|nr:TIGR01777 family oxidoreductase [Nitrospinota bacterium]MDA1109099.1 TIGR01777 family oxidoreductase [Nitrospinota bacterium]
MKILVTGATGFIGKELVKKLSEKGHEIVVLTRNSESASFHLPVHCKIKTWNPEENALSPSTLKGVEAVINLAGEGIADRRWSATRKRQIMQSRVMSVRRLVDAMKVMDNKPKVFVSASAIGFYGDRGEMLLDETISTGNGFLSEVCQAWENETFKAQELGVRTVTCRVGMVLGHDGGALNKMLPPFKMGLGGRLGNGSQWMSWIHIDDLVNMMIHAVETPALDGIYNAVSPNPVRNDDFTKVLGDVLKCRTIFPVPGFVLKIGLGELSDLLLSSQKVSARKICDSGFTFKYPQLKEALEEVCGHSCHELQMEQWVPQSIHKTFAFFKEAANLEKLTPDTLRFKVVNQTTQDIQEGTKLDYRLSLHGIPMRWQSEITDWQPNNKFSDIQLKGPYSHWYHTHEFFEKDGGTLVRDKVKYRVPFGTLGDLVAGKWIRNDLETIFKHRHKTIEKLMGA